MATKLTDADREAILRAVPQRLVGRMLGGRQTVHLQRFADQWGFPVDVKVVDLFDVLSRLWEFLKRHGPVLKVLLEDDGSDGDENALGTQYMRAKIRKTRADADAAELRVDQKAGRLLDREKVHEIFERLAGRVQRASDKAQSRWGSDGHDFMLSLTEGFAADIRVVLDLADQPAIEAVK